MAAAIGGRRRRRSGQHWSTASSPAPLPLPCGADIEVCVDGEGFHGSWYEATVVDSANGRRVRDYTATYSHLVADDGFSALTEVFPASQVRPRPPPPPPSESSSPPPRFHLHDIVEAFHYDGWWTGIVMATLDSPDPGPGASATASVTVGFPITRETIEFPPHLVRPRRDYVDGHWVPSRAAMAAPSFKLRVYKVGEKVEVGRHRDFYGYSWYPIQQSKAVGPAKSCRTIPYMLQYISTNLFKTCGARWPHSLHMHPPLPATVAWVVDELSYVVDYGEGNAAEYVHWQFIRPALEHFCRDSGSELQLVPGNEVEAYCRGAWSLGEVDRVIRGKWKYKVIVGNKKEYRLVTKVVELLKPINNWNDWIGNERRIVTASAKRPSNFRRLSVSGESPRPPVDVTSNGDEQHSHDPESPATKKSKKDLKQLDGILAEGSEHSPHCSLVMGTPLSDQNRNGHVCTDHSATQVAKSNRVMETVIPSLDYRVQQAGGKVDQQAGGKVDESSGFLRHLQNARSSKSTIDSSPFRSCSASESLLPSPQSLSSLRPADEYLFRPPNNFSGNRRRIVVAKRLVNLRTLSMSCENPSSPVDVTSNGDEYSFDPGSATKKSRKDLKQLDGTLAEDLEHSSMVMGTPLSDQNRNDHVCTDHSTTQVAKSNRVMETVIPSIDYRVQQAGGKVDQQAGGKVDQQSGGKVDESSGFQHRLQNASSSQSTIDSSPLRGCSASESLLPSPLADGKPLFVKSSAMWPQIEAMDVFSAHRQRPHFLPLREFSPIMREGMALGLMAVFPDLVRNIKKASIDNNMEWFEDKFSTLRHLEGHGFSVQSLHSTLTKLVKIKSQDTICLGEMDKLDVEIEVETASLTRMGALLDEKDSSIAELEQKLGALRQETQKIAAEMETKGTKLLRLKSKHSKFKEAYGAAKLEFHSVLAAL